MSLSFIDYSKYYDLLYKDKDYLSESKFIAQIINHFQPSAKSILDLGCGTGNHDLLLSDFGYQVSGVDLSETMISIAKSKQTDSCTFQQGDARSIRLDQKFDVILSLFHVMSYQNKNEEVVDFFKTISHHLRPGGIAIFDYWYGPAVLKTMPEKRTKQLESDEIKIERLAIPEINDHENVVTVNYKMKITDKSTKVTKEIIEKHPMRYFFSPEIEQLLKESSLKTISHKAWPSEQAEPSEDIWAAYHVVTK